MPDSSSVVCSAGDVDSAPGDVAADALVTGVVVAGPAGEVTALRTVSVARLGAYPAALSCSTPLVAVGATSSVSVTVIVMCGGTV